MPNFTWRIRAQQDTRKTREEKEIWRAASLYSQLGGVVSNFALAELRRGVQLLAISIGMNTPKQEGPTDKSIALGLLRIATSPLVVRTVFFFSLCLAIVLALVFKAHFSKDLLWMLPLLLLFSAALALRTLWNRQPTGIQGPTVYDKAEYHYDGDFPKGLPRRQAFVHTGMFVGWLIEHDMIADGFLEETQGFKEHKVTGAQVFKAWDGTLTSDVLTDEGNAFAKYYYNGEAGQGGPYFDDYEAALVGDLPDLYHVKDTWDNFDIIKKKIDQRYEAWKKQK